MEVQELQAVRRAAYAKMAAAMAKTRPPKEMAVPAAAPVDDSGTLALVVALPDEPEVAAELEAMAPVLLGTTTAVELPPTMGTTMEDPGAMGVAVAAAGVETAAGVDTTTGVETTTSVEATAVE